MSGGVRGDVPESLLAKVRALLAKAEHENTAPEEAAAYTAKAAELMARYGIERAMLADADPAADPIADREIVLAPPYALDKRDLLARVALPLRCRIVYRQRHVEGRKQVSASLFGFRSDIDRVEMIFTSLLVQAAHALAVEVVPPREDKAAYRRAWLAGFADAVGRRLEEAERRARERADAAAHRDEGGADPGRSASLVLADRTSRVDEAFAARYGHLGKARRRTLSGSGARRGYAAGQRADLEGPRVDGARRRSVGKGHRAARGPLPRPEPPPLR